jgi:hypothetical protein
MRADAVWGGSFEGSVQVVRTGLVCAGQRQQVWSCAEWRCPAGLRAHTVITTPAVGRGQSGTHAMHRAPPDVVPCRGCPRLASSVVCVASLLGRLCAGQVVRSTQPAQHNPGWVAVWHIVWLQWHRAAARTRPVCSLCGRVLGVEWPWGRCNACAGSAYGSV